MHRCSVCRRAVIMLDGNVIRACCCEGAVVVGEMRATMRSHGRMGLGPAPASDHPASASAGEV